MSRVSMVTAAGLSFLLTISGAEADDILDRRRVPPAELRAEGQRKRFGPWSVSWSWCNPDGTGGAMNADGIPIPPKHGVLVRPGRFRAAIRLDKEERPDAVHLGAKTELDPVFGPMAPGEKVRWRLRARRVGDRVIGWVIHLRSRVEDHLYLPLRVRWTDDCELGSGDALYVLHVEVG